jgi:predicted Abi (CAAX) family protease
MNSSSSHNTGHRFPFSSGHNVMNGRTIYVTLAVTTALGFLSILLEYALQGRNPLNRLGFAVFMSVVPALGALLVLKLTTYFESWRGAAIVYVAFFVLIIMIQGVARMFPAS